MTGQSQDSAEFTNQKTDGSLLETETRIKVEQRIQESSIQKTDTESKSRELQELDNVAVTTYDQQIISSTKNTKTKKNRTLFVQI